MELQRLDLAYSVEPRRDEPNEPPADWVWLTVESLGPDGPLGPTRKFPVAPATAVFSVAARLAQHLRSAVPLVGDGHPAESRPLAAWLEEYVLPVGRDLAALLLPPPVAEAILASPFPLALEFRADPRLQEIPWEALFVGRDFLGFTHAVGRQVTVGNSRPPSTGPIPTGPLRGAWIVDPCPLGLHALRPELVDRAWATLSGWWACPESARLGFTGDSISIQAPVSTDRFSDLVRAHDVVIAVCHHAASALSSHGSPVPGGDGLWLTDDAGTAPCLYGPGAFLDALQPPAQPPELVCWLACESGLATGWAADWPSSDQLHGFVDAALRAGVRHFIGSRLLVPQTAALDLLEPLLAETARGLSIGEALRRARVAARRNDPDPASGGSLIGLAFSHFGRPWQGLLTSTGERLGGALAHPCAHEEAGVRCARLYRPHDPGARQHRCHLHASVEPSRETDELRAPCANPYGHHATGPVPWVAAAEDGWTAVLHPPGADLPRLVKLCPACRRLALDRGELVHL